MKCVKWYEAVTTKYVRNIATIVDKLWVKWVNHVYLKGTDWWVYEWSQRLLSLYWKKVCHMTRHICIEDYT